MLDLHEMRYENNGKAVRVVWREGRLCKQKKTQRIYWVSLQSEWGDKDQTASVKLDCIEITFLLINALNALLMRAKCEIIFALISTDND